MNLFKPGDILLGLILISIGYLAIFRFNPGGEIPQTAFIQINNHIEYEVSLGNRQVLQLEEFNPPVIVQIHENAIGIIRNDCEQKICIKMGNISKLGEMIVCVPKKILIYIPFSNDQQGAIKAITG